MARKSRKHLYNTQTKTEATHKEKRYYTGIYLRTSSNEQKGDSIENQRKLAEAYIKSDTDLELRKVYVDYGISSFAYMRPGFNDMLQDIMTGIINCVIVKDISRFTRDYLEAGEILQLKFPVWGVRFISINDNFDSLHSSATELGIALQSLLSFSYSLDLSKKIQKAIEVRQKTGDYIPSKLPYGYIKVQTEHGTEWKADKCSASIVREIFENAIEGLSAYAVASTMNKQCKPSPNGKFWTSGSILRMLRNPSYTGTFITGKTRNDISAERKTTSLPPKKWIKHEHHHEPIIDDIMFYKVQQILSERPSAIPQRKKKDDFFFGKLYCGLCGRKMRQKLSSNGNVYYICPRRDESAYTCANKSRSEAKIKEQVFLILSEKLKDLKACYDKTLEYENSLYFQRKTQEQDKLLRLYEAELDRLNQLFVSVYERSVTNYQIQSADIRGLIQYLNHSRTVLQERISEIQQERQTFEREEGSTSAKYQPYFRFHNCDVLTEDMVAAMVERVYVNSNGVSIEKR